MLRREPGFEEGGGFGTFDAVACGVEDAAADCACASARADCVGVSSVEGEPIRKMKVERDAFDR